MMIRTLFGYAALFSKRKCRGPQEIAKAFPRIKVIAPDIILMDLWIPVMGGEAMTKLIKEDEATRSYPGDLVFGK